MTGFKRCLYVGLGSNGVRTLEQMYAKFAELHSEVPASLGFLGIGLESVESSNFSYVQLQHAEALPATRHEAHELFGEHRATIRSAVAAVEETIERTSPEPMAIYLIFSVTDIIGSATYLDMSALLKERFPMSKLTAFVVGSNLAKLNEDSSADVHAALMEMDYLMNMKWSDSISLEYKHGESISIGSEDLFNAIMFIEDDHAHTAIISTAYNLSVKGAVLSDTSNMLMAEGVLNILNKKAWVTMAKSCEIDYDGEQATKEKFAALLANNDSVKAMNYCGYIPIAYPSNMCFIGVEDSDNVNDIAEIVAEAKLHAGSNIFGRYVQYDYISTGVKGKIMLWYMMSVMPLYTLYNREVEVGEQHYIGEVLRMMKETNHSLFPMRIDYGVEEEL